MERKAKIYIKNKLLKYAIGTNKRGGFTIFLFKTPKNFQKNIDEAEQAVAKQKSKKKKYGSLIFFLVNLVIIIGILVYQVINSEDMSVGALLSSKFSFGLFLLLFLVWFLIMNIDAYRTNILVKRSTGKSRPFLAYKTVALGKYYDSITPMATGGQPFQIFYLSQRGFNASTAISVPMGRYVISQICVSCVWIVALIVGLSTDLGSGFTFIKPLCVLGFALNIVFIGTVVLLTVNQRIGKKLVVWTLRFLQKIKIVKNYEKQYNKVIKTVGNFQSTIKNFTKSKGTFILLILSSMLIIMLTYSLPFLVYSCLIGYFDFSMWAYLTLIALMIDMAQSFIPLPGGTGVSELSFTALFAVVFVNSATLTWALIFWRFITYYIYLIQGLFVLTYDKLIGNSKYRWLKKKWELEKESMSFTQDKLMEFKINKPKKTKNLV